MYMNILLLTKTATRKREGQTSRINPFSPSRSFNKTHFGLILKVKVFGTRKRPSLAQYPHTNPPDILSPYISSNNYWENLFKGTKYFPLDDHFIYSYNPFSWFCIDAVGRKLILVTLGAESENCWHLFEQPDLFISQDHSKEVQRAVRSPTGSDLYRHYCPTKRSFGNHRYDLWSF